MRYKIWDKEENILTPNGQLFNKDEWQEYCPISKYVDIVICGGEVNGSFYYIYSEFKEQWKRQGLDFSECTTQQEVLDMIEQEENARSQRPAIDYQEEMMYALQDIAINTMPSEEEL